MSNLHFLRTQRILCLLSIGICEVLEKGIISYDEAGQLMFWPWMVELCKKNGANEEVILMIEMGTELEDIKKIVGDEEWMNTLNKIRDIAKLFLMKPKDDYSELDRWIEI